MVLSLLLANGAPTADTERFSSLAGCSLYLQTYYSDDIRHTFKLECVEVGRILCEVGVKCQDI